MTFDPGVTVAIPSIPVRHESLHDAIRSVLTQEHPADAISVAIDLDRRGAWHTRNRALAQVRTEWTAFLDDDDRLMPHHLSHLLEHAAASGADVIYPWFEVVGGTDPLNWEGNPFDAEQLRRSNFIPITLLVRTELILDVGGFPQPGVDFANVACEDWGCWVRMLDAGARFHPTHVRSWWWHHHAGNTNGQGDRW